METFWDGPDTPNHSKGSFLFLHVQRILHFFSHCLIQLIVYIEKSDLLLHLLGCGACTHHEELYTPYTLSPTPVLKEGRLVSLDTKKTESLTERRGTLLKAQKP